jgi:hypothetical protein
MIDSKAASLILTAIIDCSAYSSFSTTSVLPVNRFTRCTRLQAKRTHKRAAGHARRSVFLHLTGYAVECFGPFAVSVGASTIGPSVADGNATSLQFSSDHSANCGR